MVYRSDTVFSFPRILLKNVGVRTYPERGVHGEIVHTLGSQIVAGTIAPGVALVPESLGEQFGASRTVVREALKVLASKGLVDSVRKRGTFVTPAHSWNRLDPDVLKWRFVTRDESRLPLLGNYS